MWAVSNALLEYCSTGKEIALKMLAEFAQDYIAARYGALLYPSTMAPPHVLLTTSTLVN